RTVATPAAVAQRTMIGRMAARRPWRPTSHGMNEPAIKATKTPAPMARPLVERRNVATRVPKSSSDIGRSLRDGGGDVAGGVAERPAEHLAQRAEELEADGEVDRQRLLERLRLDAHEGRRA